MSHRRRLPKRSVPARPQRRRPARAWRLAITAVVGLGVAIGSASGSDGREGRPPAERSRETAPQIDLIAYALWDGSPRVVLIVQITGLDGQAASLRARLYDGITDRSDLAAAVTGDPDVELIRAWPIEIPDRSNPLQTTSDPIQIRLPDDAATELRRRIENGAAASGLLPLHLNLANAEGDILHTMRAFLHTPTTPTGTPTTPAPTTPTGTPADAPPNHTSTHPGPDNPDWHSDNTGDGGLAVAAVFDLRLPLAHDYRYTARFDPEALGTAVDLANAISDSATAEREESAAAVVLHPETLDALALTGDDPAAEALLKALDRSQILLSTWTGLDVNTLAASGRGDIVIDGLLLGKRTQRRVGITASSVMWLDTLPTPQAVTWLTQPPTGASAFTVRSSEPYATAAAVAGEMTAAADAGTVDPPLPIAPVQALADADGGMHRVVIADPFLEWLLSGTGNEPHPRRPRRVPSATAGPPADDADPELAVHHLLTELLRLNRSGSSPTAVVVYMPTTDPKAARLLLDELQNHAELRPMTVTAVLTESAATATGDPGRPAADASNAANAADAGGLDDHHGYSGYLGRRTAIEQRLDAYESLIGADANHTHPLRTLLAASSAESLRSEERDAFLTAIDSRIREGTSGIDLVSADRITIVADTVDLPLAVINSQPVPVTVAIELDSASDKIDFPVGDRRIARLEPGRNSLSIPVEIVAPVETVVNVTIATPGDGVPIVLSAGHRSVRFIKLSGVGAVLSACASLGVALWWVRHRKHQPR